MKKKPAPTPNQEPRGWPISDAALNDLEEKIKEKAKANPKVKDRSVHIFRYLDMIREHIRENDARRAVTTTSFLDYELWQTGFWKPLYFKIGQRKGGGTHKERKGIKAAAQRILSDYPELMDTSRDKVFSLWCHFASNHYGYEKAFEIDGYRVWFQVDVKSINDDKIPLTDMFKRGMLFEESKEEKMQGIKLPTFRNYFSIKPKGILTK